MRSTTIAWKIQPIPLHIHGVLGTADLLRRSLSSTLYLFIKQLQSKRLVLVPVKTYHLRLECDKSAAQKIACRSPLRFSDIGLRGDLQKLYDLLLSTDVPWSYKSLSHRTKRYKVELSEFALLIPIQQGEHGEHLRSVQPRVTA